jgi:hypothetical protein
LGLVQLDAGDGTVRRLADDFAPDPTELESVSLVKGKLCVCDSQHRVWNEQPEGTWALDDSAGSGWDRLKTVAKNMLMTCRQTGPHRFQFDFEFPNDLPALRNTALQPALIQDGIFLFDDLRDVRLQADRLIVAARAGVWEYDLKAIQTLVLPPARARDVPSPTARQPACGVFFASSSTGNSAGRKEIREQIGLTNLTRFATARAGEDLRLLSTDEAIEFFRPSDRGWGSRTRQDVAKLLQRDCFDSRTGITWQLSLDPSQQPRFLMVRKKVDASSGEAVVHQFPSWQTAPDDLVNAFASQGSIWVAYRTGIVWIGKDRFP